MPELKGSQTEKNLAFAFAGESQARNKYTYFASVAKKEGYEKIAAVFLETAENEKEHAKMWFKALGELGSTAANLKAAADGEHGEWTEMYRQFAETARAEGFADIARKFELVAGIEKRHEERYLKILKSMEDCSIFRRGESKLWICRNCGYVCESAQAPEKCPCCDHPKSYFQVLSEDF